MERSSEETSTSRSGTAPSTSGRSRGSSSEASSQRGRRGKSIERGEGEYKGEEGSIGEEEYTRTVTDLEVINEYLRRQAGTAHSRPDLGKGCAPLDRMHIDAALFQVKKADARSQTVGVVLDHVRQIAPETKFVTSGKLADLAHITNTQVCSRVAPTPYLRACGSQLGVALYAKSGLCGVQFPLSPFVVDILRLLGVPPGQLTGVAWCHVNSFEYFFHKHQEELPTAPVRLPTVGMFLHLYSFIPVKSWVTVKKRGKINQFGTISKIDSWNRGWFYLHPSSEDYQRLGAQGVPLF